MSDSATRDRAYDKSHKQKDSLSVYIVTQRGSNRRVRQLSTLSTYFPRLTVLTPPTEKPLPNGQHICIKKLPNITGFFRLIGLSRLKQSLDKHLYFPSPNILFAKAVTQTLQRYVSQDLEAGRRACLITCLPPHDLVFTGLTLKRRYPELHWIIDWQDLWSYDEYYAKRIPAYRKEQLLATEKEAFDTCDANVVVNDHAKEILVEEYGIAPRSVASIPLAFDEGHQEQAQETLKASAHREVKIGFLGTLFKPTKVPGEDVIKVLKSVRDQGISLQFHIYGGVPREKEQELAPETWIRLHGWMDHHESLRRISACDFLLLALTGGPNAYAMTTMKLPYYLTLQTPILALVPEESVAAAIVRETRTGYVIPLSHETCAQLESIFQKYENGKFIFEPDEAAISRYSWEHVSQQWIDLIHKAMEC